MLHRKLTPREVSVLNQIMTGRSNREIGEILEISTNTVKIYVRAILEKTQTSNRTGAALWGKENSQALAN